MKLVLDTDVVVAGFQSPSGASRALFGLAYKNKISLHASVALVLEYEAVLTRDNVLDRMGLSKDQMIKALNGFLSVVTPVGIHYQWRPVASDPNDDLVIEAAVNASALMIVSFNIKDMQTASDIFDIEIMRPRDALRKVK